MNIALECSKIKVLGVKSELNRTYRVLPIFYGSLKKNVKSVNINPESVFACKDIVVYSFPLPTLLRELIDL